MPPTGKDLAEYHQLLQRRQDSSVAEAALAAATREFEKEQALNQSPARQQQAAECVQQREAQRTAAATVLAQLGPLLATHPEPRA
jgi:hypothetical protein